MKQSYASESEMFPLPKEYKWIAVIGKGLKVVYANDINRTLTKEDVDKIHKYNQK